MNTVPADEPVPIAEPTADSGLLLGAGSDAPAGFGVTGVAGVDVPPALFRWWRRWWCLTGLDVAGAGAEFEFASPLELARFRTAWPAAPCCASCLDVEFDTGFECLWCPEPPVPGLGSASQYWSIADVPGGAWQVAAGAADGSASGARTSTVPATASLYL